MGGKSKGGGTTSKPVLLPEQKRIWDFLTQQLIPQALGKETYATQIGTQRARDESARLMGMQQQQVQQMASQGMGSGQRAQMLAQAHQQSLQSAMQNILAQRQAAQQNALALLQGMPLQPGTQTVTKGTKGTGFGKQLGGIAAKGALTAGMAMIPGAGPIAGAAAMGSQQMDF